MAAALHALPVAKHQIRQCCVLSFSAKLHLWLYCRLLHASHTMQQATAWLLCC